MAEISKTLKEGERIVAPSRRPDGTLRKPIRIRAGYVPQDEVAIYQSKGTLWKKEMQSQQLVPPGYDPPLDSKPKTKSVKRNERKKEKRLQAALEKGKNLEGSSDGDIKRDEEEEQLLGEDVGHASEAAKSLTSQMNDLSVSTNSVVSTPADSTDDLDPNAPSQDIDKRIRALKKKIRLAEAQQQKSGTGDVKAEQLGKLESWQKELKLLEGKKAKQHSARVS